MKTFLNRLVCAFVFVVMLACSKAGENQLPVSAPMTTDIAGQTSPTANLSVFRILCPKQNRSGTGFLHKSGRVITAAHVVADCSATDIFILTAAGQMVAITNVLADTNIDIALLMPAQPINAPSFVVSTNDSLPIGEQIETWGFPSGYSGFSPLLSIGCLSGIQQMQLANGQIIKKTVVNAAFNSGNSGGPLIDIESHTVIGVVQSKLAPMPPEIEGAIDALKKNSYGVEYTERAPDGSTKKISEAQLLAGVIDYLRSQVQLVIGYAAPPADLRKFLQSQRIDP